MQRSSLKIYTRFADELNKIFKYGRYILTLNIYTKAALNILRKHIVEYNNVLPKFTDVKLIKSYRKTNIL